jgi:hypothetical protein
MRFKNLLVGGCSFTQDGICGSPPTITSAGGCSFIEDDAYVAAQPNSWAGFLAKKLQVTSMVNTATSNHGNILIANTILECINRFSYNPKETLVVVNLTEPWRFDLPCAYDHPDSDLGYIPWNQDLIPYSYLDRRRKIITQLEKNIDFAQIEYFTSNTVEFLFNFLENKQIPFYFLTMNDCSSTKLQAVIDKFQKHFIKLSPGPSMLEYCQHTNSQISKDDFHPTRSAHEKIADQVYNYIVENEIHLPVL